MKYHKRCWSESGHVRLLSPMMSIVLLSAGCATVHQMPLIDRNMMSVYASQDSTQTETEPAESEYFFELSLQDAINSIATTGYNHEIPFYYPAFSADHAKARMVSGPFIATCKQDCNCDKQGAKGHGANAATGILVIEMETRHRDDVSGTAVKVSTMYYRTQSEGGEYGYIKNLYFQSLGRIEEAFLEGLHSHGRQ